MSRVSSIGNSPNLCQSSSKNRPGCYLAKPFADSSGAELIQIKNLHKPYTKTFCRNLPSPDPHTHRVGWVRVGYSIFIEKLENLDLSQKKKMHKYSSPKVLKILKFKIWLIFMHFFFDLISFLPLCRDPPPRWRWLTLRL